MKNKKFLISLLAACFFLFSGTGAFAAEKKIITLNEAINMALASSEDLAMSANTVKISESNFIKARQELYPYLSASLSWVNNFKYPSFYPSTSMNDYSFDAGLSLNQKIFTFGRIGKNIDSIKKQIEEGRMGKEALKREIVYYTKFVYYNIYFSKRVYSISLESLERAKKNKEISGERSAGGRVSKYDNIKSMADIAGRVPAVNNSLASLKTVFHALITLLDLGNIGMPENLNDLPVDINDDIFPKEYEAINRAAAIADMRKNNPELKKSKFAVESANNRIEMMKKFYYPEISLFASYNRRGYDNSPIPGSGALNDYGMIGLRASLPLFDAGSRRESIHQTELVKKNTELVLSKTEKKLVLDIETAIAKYNEYLKTLEANMKAVKFAKDSFNMSQDLFRSGKMSIINLNDAELYLTGQKLNLEKTLINIEIEKAAIEKLSGKTHE